MGVRRHVVVVGAGVVGCALARELAARGCGVTVVERQRPAAGATHATFGWLNNQAYFRNADGVTEANAHGYFLLHRLALGAWRRLEAQLGDVGIRWNGMVTWCAPGSPEQERFEGELARRQRWGSPTRRVDAADVAALVPGCVPGPVGTGFYAPDEGNVDPYVAVAALTGSCRELGVEFRWPCGVNGFRSKGDRLTGVDTDDGPLGCDAVVVACGVGTPELAGQVGVSVPLVESHGAIVHLPPAPLVLGPVLQAPAVHIVQRPDGRAAVARHFAGTPVVEADDVDEAALLRTAREVLPALATDRVERTTVGRRVLPADGLPIVGRSPAVQDVWCVATNAGISLGPLLAQLLATEVVDDVRPGPLAPYGAERFTEDAHAG